MEHVVPIGARPLIGTSWKMNLTRVEAAAYVDGVGPCSPDMPRRNLTGDPYFTDGKRAGVILSASRMTPRYLAWA